MVKARAHSLRVHHLRSRSGGFYSNNVAWLAIRRGRGRVAISLLVDLRQGPRDFFRIAWPHQFRYLLAVAKEHERRPEFHAERAAEPPAARVGDLDMAHARVSA